MTERDEKAQRFRALHVPGDPLVLFNAWDAGSTRAVADAGAHAIATGSWSVAAAHGLDDGEQMPLELVLANLTRIVAVTTLPVTLDLESGYGHEPADVAHTLLRAAAAGAVGCNIEDADPGDGSVRSAAAQAARIAAARSALDRAGLAFFINARTDVFLRSPVATHDQAKAETALQRAQAYADSGADGFFVPGLVDETLIAWIAERSPLPLNVMVGAHSPNLATLASLGVARVSHGPGPYRLAMRALSEAARAAMQR